MVEEKNNINDENLKKSVDDNAVPVTIGSKGDRIISLTSLKEQLGKMRYMHKSSFANYSGEIRKIKKKISVTLTKHDKK